MLMLNEETLLMIHNAGFEPCLVQDLAEGDVILIDHALNRNYTSDVSSRNRMPTEMTVSNLRSASHPDHDEDGRVIGVFAIYTWVGLVNRNGLKVHCSYNGHYECWKQVKQACKRFHPGEKCIPGRNHPGAKE